MPTIPTVPTMGPNSSTPNKGMPTDIDPRFMSAFKISNVVIYNRTILEIYIFLFQ